MRENILRAKFPRLDEAGFRITSPHTSGYNCVAWAAGSMDSIWLPEAYPEGVYVWPEDARREYTLASWIAAFRTLSYEQCGFGDLEEGFEKVAIYALGTLPKHVARQLPSGRWTSKVGTMEDIEHELFGLVGERYGEPAVFLRRARPVTPERGES